MVLHKQKKSRLSRSFSASLCNIRGLNSNVNSVHHLLSSSTPSVLFLTETQISGDGDLTHLQFPGYSLHHCFRFKGGVCAYTHSSFSVSPLPTFNCRTSDFQFMWLKFSFAKTSKYFCCVYRSPNCKNPSLLFSQLNVNCETILQSDPTAELCILGDFNVHNSEWLVHSSHTDPAGREAEFFAITNSLSQIVSFPTRIPDRAGDSLHTLDLVLTTHPDSYSIHSFAPLGSSDHCLITCCQSLSPTVSAPPSRRTFWRYSSADWDGMRDFFADYPWEVCCFSNDPSVFAENLTRILNDGMIQFIPHFSKPGKPSSPEWFNHACSRVVSKKNRLFKRWRTHPTPSTRSDYVIARNACTATIDKAKDMFVSRKAAQLSDAPTGSRSFWSLAKAVGRNFCAPTFPPLPDSQGNLKSLPQEKAELFAELFASNSTLSPPNAAPTYPVASSHFSLPSISTKKVRQALLSIDTSKPPGPDGIPSILFQKCAPELSPILARLFRLSLSTGVVPSSWKNSHVLPIPKRGSLSDSSNYRPISITPILCKIMESLLAKQLLCDLEGSSLLSDHQYGFRQNRSTGDLLSYVSHVWSSALDSFGETELVCLDVSKAFDRVWHEDLLAKLPMYGLHPCLINWIGSFLMNRSIQVRLEGAVSRVHYTNAGVPQGSVLSPTLFLLFINDLLSSVSGSIHAFADDATLHLSTCYNSQRSASSRISGDRAQTIATLNSDLANIFDWGSSNAATFNPSKSIHLSLSLRRTTPNLPLSIDSTLIPQTSACSLLGLTFSSNLSWSSHVKLVATRASRKVGFLFRSRKYFSPHQLLLLYKSQIRPTMEYCCHIWGGAPTTFLSLLEQVQRKIVRLIDTPSLTDHLQSLSHRRDVSSLSLFYRYYHGKCSSELASAVPLPQSFPRATRQFSSSHPYQVSIPRCRTELFTSSFFPRTARLWNSLPLSVFPTSFNLQLFKLRVNAYLSNPPCPTMPV